RGFLQQAVDVVPGRVVTDGAATFPWDAESFPLTGDDVLKITLRVLVVGIERYVIDDVFGCQASTACDTVMAQPHLDLTPRTLCLVTVHGMRRHRVAENARLVRVLVCQRHFVAMEAEHATYNSVASFVNRSLFQVHDGAPCTGREPPRCHRR